MLISSGDDVIHSINNDFGVSKVYFSELWAKNVLLNGEHVLFGSLKNFYQLQYNIRNYHAEILFMFTSHFLTQAHHLKKLASIKCHTVWLKWSSYWQPVLVWSKIRRDSVSQIHSFSANWWSKLNKFSLRLSHFVFVLSSPAASCSAALVCIFNKSISVSCLLWSFPFLVFCVVFIIFSKAFLMKCKDGCLTEWVGRWKQQGF